MLINLLIACINISVLVKTRFMKDMNERVGLSCCKDNNVKEKNENYSEK